MVRRCPHHFAHIPRLFHRCGASLCSCHCRALANRLNLCNLNPKLVAQPSVARSGRAEKLKLALQSGANQIPHVALAFDAVLPSHFHHATKLMLHWCGIAHRPLHRASASRARTKLIINFLQCSSSCDDFMQSCSRCGIVH